MLARQPGSAERLCLPPPRLSGRGRCLRPVCLAHALSTSFSMRIPAHHPRCVCRRQMRRRVTRSHSRPPLALSVSGLRWVRSRPIVDPCSSEQQGRGVEVACVLLDDFSCLAGKRPIEHSPRQRARAAFQRPPLRIRAVSKSTGALRPTSRAGGRRKTAPSCRGHMWRACSRRPTSMGAAAKQMMRGVAAARGVVTERARAPCRTSTRIEKTTTRRRHGLRG